MKNRKSMVCFVVLLVACSAVFSSAARKDEVTLVMVPREEGAVQLGMDIAGKYPTLLISYKVGANKAVSLHGWTGTQWVNVSLEDFQSGGFFRKGPDSALVVEKAGFTVPAKMLPPSGWCANAAKITTTEIRPLLHLVGQYYNFSYKEWQWFAARYNVDMDAINPEGLNVAWYHKRMGEHLKPRKQQGASDLQYWVSIRQPEVVTATVAAGSTEMEDEIAEEEKPENLLTNDVPAAVIMGAADAAEEQSGAPGPADETAVEDKAPEDPAPATEVVVEEKVPEDPSPTPVDEAAVEEKDPENPGEMQ
jgi:hypothetical protein